MRLETKQLLASIAFAIVFGGAVIAGICWIASKYP